MMRRAAVLFTLFTTTTVAAWGQTLSSLLRAGGIPIGQFTSQELGEQINAAEGREGSREYVVYLTLNPNGDISGAPVLVRYDRATGKVIRYNFKPGEMENCCGSPLEIDFTEHYLLVEFHDNPSADTVLVAGKDLHYRSTLYGFDFHEIAPDLVVYVEDLIHFAAQQPERLAWADLQSGRGGELYPPKGDKLRAAFAALNKEHMPTDAACQNANDPCDPAIYDEDIGFVRGYGPNEFAIRVTRTGDHTWVTKGADVDVPAEESLYEYKLRDNGWFYCEQDVVPAKLVKVHDADALEQKGGGTSCEPNLPVVPDTSGQLNPFWPDTRKEK
ncbi:MAG: hypothetical protein WAL75_15040 [Terracidiphilus sp.]